MRLKGSVTVENAVIIPLFMIITVSLIMLNLYIHDTLIAKSTALKLGVRAELELSGYAQTAGMDKSTVIKNVCDMGQAYVAGRSISLQNPSVNVQEDRNKVSVICTGSTPDMISRITGNHNVSARADIGVNAPAGFIRLINAVKNVIAE